MQTPVMFSGGSVAPSNSATNYCGLIGAQHNTAWTTVSTAQRIPIPVAGTISKLYARFPTLGTGTYALTVRKNGTDQTLTCTVDQAGTGTASDTSNSFTVAAGDLVDIKCIPSGTPTAQTEPVQISMLFEATASGESFILGGNRANTVSITTGTYFAPGWADFGSSTIAGSSSVMPTAGTIDKLYVNFPTAPGSGNTLAVTIYKNGSATGVTCSVADTATTGSDLSNSITVAQNDLISFFVQATAGTPAATYIRIGARFVPTVNGESVMFGGWAGVPAVAADRFVAASGAVNTGVTTESNAYNLVPVAFTAKKLTLSLVTGPGGGTRTRSIWLRQGTGTQADTSLTAVCTDAQTSANDNSNTVSVAVSDFIDIRTNSSASATSPGNMRTSMVAYIAPAAAGASMLTLLGVG